MKWTYQGEKYNDSTQIYTYTLFFVILDIAF